MFERFRDRTRFWLDLKGGLDRYPGLEERVISTMEVYDVLEATLVLSVDRPSLARVRRLNPEVRVGALVVRREALHSWRDAEGGVDAICTPAANTTRELVSFQPGTR